MRKKALKILKPLGFNIKKAAYEGGFFYVEKSDY